MITDFFNMPNSDEFWRHLNSYQEHRAVLPFNKVHDFKNVGDEKTYINRCPFLDGGCKKTPENLWAHSIDIR